MDHGQQASHPCNSDWARAIYRLVHIYWLDGTLHWPSNVYIHAYLNIIGHSCYMWGLCSWKTSHILKTCKMRNTLNKHWPWKGVGNHMTESKWSGKSGKLPTQLTGHAEQHLPWPQTGYWCSSWHRDKIMDNGSAYNESSLYMASYSRRCVANYVPDYMKSHSLLWEPQVSHIFIWKKNCWSQDISVTTHEWLLYTTDVTHAQSVLYWTQS